MFNSNTQDEIDKCVFKVLIIMHPTGVMFASVANPIWN